MLLDLRIFSTITCKFMHLHPSGEIFSLFLKLFDAGHTIYGIFFFYNFYTRKK